MMELATFIASRCEQLQAPSYLNLSLSILILVGILVSYLPQHYRIIARGTSEGISPYFILLGTTSGTSAFASILVLPASRADVACCKTVSSFECFAGLLGIFQVGVQWFCFAIILLLFLIFFPRNPVLPQSTTVKAPTWRTALGVAFLCLAHGLLVIFVSAWFQFSRPSYLGTLANTLGLMAAGLACVQYFPQIWTTFQLGHVGSLSIPMMVIQTPGSFVWAGSLAVRLGTEGWSIWGVYLVTGCLQGCLLVMGIYFELQARKTGTNLESEATTSLLADNTPSLQNEFLETDDNGNTVIESGGLTERTPLLSKQSNNIT
ncbi:hypothetical protein VE01_01448 [Pseudogymnoascus verrucosus]|uniref:PQ loop repeat protein n=1 Tax=Pseudogymnoascus verrucosus TaxID=342668 RepID=A0A1B8GWS1_9PEZI|nr:uncharacterized protein VE01_01448 [Pseudogymnoascus verrucosus]OBU00278.2 hypothetical protein VE01_01448 [Pseudogymnoascus verrucosus]